VDESVPGSANLWPGTSVPGPFFDLLENQNMRSEAQGKPLRKEKIAICEKFTARRLDGLIRTP
jgi:hypothetical protein